MSNPDPSASSKRGGGGLKVAVTADADVPTVPGFKIVARLGEGGMGVVWAGIQLSTKRKVAIKFLSSGKFSSSRAKARFAREVELAASLQHPNIARVYDSGLEKGVWYYAMELVVGVPLDQFVEDNKLSLAQTLRLMEQVCQGMQHAHQRGVIHRDLKPSNILVSKDGQAHILDFGLAKDLINDSAEGMTIQGDISGTPAYMSPEQASGLASQVDTRCDVYSLGVILYGLLTRKTPHDLSGTYVSVIRRIAEEEITPPRTAMPQLSLDLEAVLLKALARKPEQRYASAAEFAGDLRDYLAGDPITARKATVWYFLSKRLRKHRVPVALAATVLVVLMGTALWSYTRVALAKQRADREAAAAKVSEGQATAALAELQANQQALVDAKNSAEQQKQRADQQAQAAIAAAEKEKQARVDLEANQQALKDAKDAAEQAKNVAEQQKRMADEHLAEAIIAQAGAEGLAAKGKEAHELLDQASDLCKSLGMRLEPVEFRWLEEESRSGSPFLSIPFGGVPLGLEENGRTMLSLSPDRHSLQWIDLSTGLTEKASPPATVRINTAVRSWSGRWVATGDDDGSLTLWDAASTKALWTMTGDKATFKDIAFSRDEKLIATARSDQTVRLVDVNEQKEITTLAQHSNVFTIAFSNDGRTLISAGGAAFGEHRLHFWDTSSGKELRTSDRHKGVVHKVAVSPSGVNVASVDWDGKLCLTEMATGKPVWDVKLHDNSDTIVWSADGNHIYAAQDDGEMAIVDASKGMIQRTLWGHRGNISLMGLSANERLCWSKGDLDHLLQVRNTGEPPPLRPIQRFSAANDPSFSPSAELLVTTDGDRRVSVRDTPTGKLLATIVQPIDNPGRNGFGAGLFLPDNRQMLIGDGRGSVCRWQFCGDNSCTIFGSKWADWVHQITLSDDGRFAAAVLQPRVCVWDLQQGAVTSYVTLSGLRLNMVHFSKDDRTISAFNSEGLSTLAVDSGEVLSQATIHARAGDNGQEAFLNENRLVVGDQNGVFGVFDAAKGQPIWKHDGVQVRKLTVTGDKQFIFTTGDDRTLKIWNAADGTSVQAIQCGDSDEHLTGIACSPVEDRFIAGSDQCLYLASTHEMTSRKNLENAAIDARTKLATNPTDGAARLTLGRWYACRSVWPWAVDCMESAEREGTPVSSVELARCYWQNDDFAAAEKAFMRASDEAGADVPYLKLCAQAVRNESSGLWGPDGVNPSK